jgi:hypothetical protein
MAAVLIALYDDHATAERVRTELVSDGFPTDRVELTSLREPGAAGALPGDSLPQKLVQYFQTLFEEAEQPSRGPQFFAERVRHGGSTITVHPRGEVETSRACEILKRSSPAELVAHGMEDQTFERAAADRNSTVVERILGTDQ